MSHKRREIMQNLIVLTKNLIGPMYRPVILLSLFSDRAAFFQDNAGAKYLS
jgi:hypothetical protein